MHAWKYRVALYRQSAGGVSSIFIVARRVKARARWPIVVTIEVPGVHTGSFGVTGSRLTLTGTDKKSAVLTVLPGSPLC